VNSSDEKPFAAYKSRSPSKTQRASIIIEKGKETQFK
jgi:hypothetical protein